MSTKITKKVVDAAKSASRDRFIWDSEVRGFGLKVTPAGRKTYVLQTRLGGRIRRYTIGTHGSPWTPDKARQEASRFQVLVRQGIDPAEEKKAAKAELGIAELCKLYLAEGCEAKKASTVALDRSRIARHIIPLLGSKRVKALSRSDIERFMADVAAGKTALDERTKKRGRAIVRGGRGIATRTMGLLGAILQFAVNRGMRPDNPARGIKRYADQKFDRFLTSVELTRLAVALSEARYGENPQAIAAIRFLLLTGVRKNEALSLCWEWVDWERSCIRLPDSKTGAKIVPLGEPALDLLASLPRVDGNPHVFPGTSPSGHFVGLQKVWGRVRAAAGLTDLRLHDLRHHFISVGASSGESLYVLGKIAGHKNNATTQRYAHLADDPVRNAANAVASQVFASLNELDHAESAAREDKDAMARSA